MWWIYICSYCIKKRKWQLTLCCYPFTGKTKTGPQVANFYLTLSPIFIHADAAVVLFFPLDKTKKCQIKLGFANWRQLFYYTTMNIWTNVTINSSYEFYQKKKIHLMKEKAKWILFFTYFIYVRTVQQIVFYPTSPYTFEYLHKVLHVIFIYHTVRYNKLYFTPQVPILLSTCIKYYMWFLYIIQ